MTQSKPDFDEKMTRNTTRAAIWLTAVSLAFFGFAINVVNYRAWEDYLLVGFPLITAGASLASIFLLQRGRPALGTGIVFFVNLIVPLLITGTVINGFWAAFSYGVISSTLLIWRSFPRRSWRWSIIATSVMLIAIVVINISNPPGRFTTPSTFNGVFAIVLAFIFTSFTYLVVRQAWVSGYIRNRIIITFSAILIPILAAFTWFNIQTQRDSLEQELTKKAEAVAISGAATIKTLLEEAIKTGDLTEEQVFDTNYVKYWEFDPASYVFDGDPASLDKYHTAYDAYTDESWQELVDSFLSQEDLVFTIPVDKNGYLPTHNTRWSSFDGRPATDRSKRIFNDPVGIKAARNTEPVLVQTYPRPGTGETLLDVSAPIFVNGKHWGAFRVGTVLYENSLLAQSTVQSATRRSLISAALLALGIFGASWFLGRSISTPIERLTENISQLTGDQFSEITDMPEITELNILSNAFNDAAARLRDSFSTLEQRVTARTKDLATVAEVGTATSTILDTQRLLQEVVDLTKERFNLYHSHIYLLDEAGRNLVLTAGAGEPGRIMSAEKRSIPLDREKSLVARAARERKGVTVNDVTQAQDFLPNPLLPDTRSELAVPMIVGGTLIGVFDIQSDQVGRFGESDVAIQTTLAAQLATSIQNVRSFEQSKRQAELQSLVNVIGSRIQRTTSIEDTLQTAIRELGSALGASRVSASIAGHQDGGNRDIQESVK